MIDKKIGGRLIGIGGDEVNKKCYEKDQDVQKALNGKTIEQAIGNFVTDIFESVTSKGKIAVVWEESVIGTASATLDKGNTLVTSWAKNTSLAKVTEAGFKAIQALVDLAYLDW